MGGTGGLFLGHAFSIKCPSGIKCVIFNSCYLFVIFKQGQSCAIERFFLSVNIVVFLVIAVVCSLFFPPRRLSLILCGIVLLWVYDVFYLVFAVGRAKKRMKHMNES